MAFATHKKKNVSYVMIHQQRILSSFLLCFQVRIVKNFKGKLSSCGFFFILDCKKLFKVITHDQCFYCMLLDKRVMMQNGFDIAMKCSKQSKRGMQETIERSIQP